jgi:hypothetical protein
MASMRIALQVSAYTGCGDKIGGHPHVDLHASPERPVWRDGHRVRPYRRPRIGRCYCGDDDLGTKLTSTFEAVSNQLK